MSDTFDRLPNDPSAAPLRQAAARAARRSARRVAIETLLARADHLPPVPRTLVTAYHGLGVSLDQLATLHKVSRRQIRRRLDHIHAILSDPCFPLTVKFASGLPETLRQLAVAHWVEGQTLRSLAAARGQTLHRIRRDIGIARSLLLLAMAKDQDVPVALALSAIAGTPRRRD